MLLFKTMANKLLWKSDFYRERWVKKIGEPFYPPGQLSSSQEPLEHLDQLGPPVVPFDQFLRLQKRVGTLILASLLEDLVNLRFWELPC